MKRLGGVITALLIMGLSAGVATGLYAAMKQLPITNYFAPANVNAVWDWHNPAQDLATVKTNAEQLRQHQINAVYVDISSMAVSSKDQTASFEDALSDYVQAMNNQHIAVYAAAGDVNWSQLANQGLPQAVLEFVYGYNQDHPAQSLVGTEFDIESYNQPEFLKGSSADRAAIITQYLDLVDALATKQLQYLSSHTSNKLSLGFTVPYWYDNENGNIENVTWHDQTGPTVFLLLNRLNQLPNSNIIVMAYRNAAMGNDGTIAHARTEIEYAQAQAPQVKVIVGQETTAVDPAKITFAGMTKLALSQQAKLSRDVFSKDSSFGGFAINDLTSYLSLKE